MTGCAWVLTGCAWVLRIDWMSDLLFILVDVFDPSTAGVFGVAGYNYDHFVIANIVFLVSSTVFGLLPFVIADCKMHFKRDADGVPGTRVSAHARTHW